MNKFLVSAISVLATVGIIGGGVALYNYLPSTTNKINISWGDSVLFGDKNNKVEESEENNNEDISDISANICTFDNLRGETTNIVSINGKLSKSPQQPESFQGYKFVGWSLTIASEKDIIDDISSYKVTNDTTFYAIYKDPLNEIYRRTFNLNVHMGAGGYNSYGINEGKDILTSQASEIMSINLIGDYEFAYFGDENGNKVELTTMPSHNLDVWAYVQNSEGQVLSADMFHSVSICTLDPNMGYEIYTNYLAFMDENIEKEIGSFLSSYVPECPENKEFVGWAYGSPYDGDEIITDFENITNVNNFHAVYRDLV